MKILDRSVKDFKGMLTAKDRGTFAYKEMNDPGVSGLVLRTSGTQSNPKDAVIPWHVVDERIKLYAPIIAQYGSVFMTTSGNHNSFGLISGSLTAAYLDWVIVENDTPCVINHIERIDANAVTFLQTDMHFIKRAMRLGILPRKGTLKAINLRGQNIGLAKRQEIEAAFGCPVLLRYACTEAGVIGVSEPGDETNLFRHMIIPVKIVDGEICVKTEGLAVSYTHGPLNLDANGWYHTGDTGYLDADGLHLTGRMKA